MKKHDDNIELNDNEFATTSVRDMLFDGMDERTERAVRIEASASAALDQHKGRPSKVFVEWLSEGRLTMIDGEVVTTPEPEPSEDEGAEDREPAAANS